MRALQAILLATVACACPLSAAEASLQKVTLVIHVHTTVSTGNLSPEQVVETAETAGLDGVVFTDSLIRHWEYGFWPLQGIIKRVIEQPSVHTYGAQRYVDTVNALNAHHAKVFAIPAFEAAPFYYWRRSPFDRAGGEIRDWNQHLLVFGLEDPNRMEQLSVGRYDPYHGNQGSRPYQKFIDEAAARGGLIVWAHPEIKHEGRHGTITDYTEAYPHLLETTTGYHGFAITYLGYLTIVGPGGLWDRLLLAYCRGRRAQPVWVIGESDWRGPQERPIQMAVTELLVEERTPEAVVRALRAGRMWAAIRGGTTYPELIRFTVSDPATGREAMMGETLISSGQVRIRVAGSRGIEGSQPLKLTLIKDGRMFAAQDVQGPSFDVEWTDARPTQMSFYRVAIENPSDVLYSNPIFIR